MKYYAGPWQWVSTPGIGSHYAAPSGAIALVDLRNIETQSAGNHAGGVGSGFFCVPDDVSLSADYELLATGDLRESQIGGAQRSAWESVFGVTLPQSTDVLIDALAYTLTNGSDPDGSSAPRPLVPLVGPPVGEASISLAGHSVVWRRHVSPQTGNSKHAKALRDLMKKDLQHIADTDPNPDHWRKVLGYQKRKYGQRWDDDSEDSFLTPKLRAKGKGRNGRTFANEPKTTATESWPSAGAITSGQNNGWSYFVGSSMTVSSNQLTCTGGSGSSWARMTTTMSGSDTYARNVYKSETGGNYGAFCVAVRKDSSGTNTIYQAQHYRANLPGSGWWDLLKWVSGTPTYIQRNTSLGISADQPIYIEANGSAITAKLNDTNTLSGTDTSISSGTYCVVGHDSGGGGGAYTSDDWSCGDIGGGGGASRPDLGLLLGVS